jgi:hypothetical protein
MTRLPQDYWEKRYAKFGHTGWNDPIIYAYDQKERLAIISEKINTLEIDPLIAIDFGCGTGDFSHLLINHDFLVWGFDPYVKPVIKSKKFQYVKQWDELGRLEIQAGIIISVTVLDHILDLNQLIDVLCGLRKIISNNGYFILIEYALDEVDQIIKTNYYQVFRIFSEWENILSSTGWDILSAKPVPHPKLAPSIGFEKYSTSFPINIINSMSANRNLFNFLSPLYKYIATKYLEDYGINDIETSPLKLIICQPA